MRQKRVSYLILCTLLSCTISSVGQNSASVPARVLAKFNTFHPKAINVEWTQSKGEPIEHNLPADYFKGRTYYNVDFAEGQSGQIWYDSAGNVLLTELYRSIDHSTAPKRLITYLDDNYYRYKLTEESMEAYSSLDNTWWYDIFVDNGTHSEPQELFFDSAGTYITSNGIQPPNSISGIFELKNPGVEILNWDTVSPSKDRGGAPYVYKVRYTNGKIISTRYYDSIGSNNIGFAGDQPFVPYEVRAKAQSIFPKFELGDWYRGDYGKDDKPDSANYTVVFSDTSTVIQPDGNYITLDSLCNVIQIMHAIQYNLMPVKARDYINAHYKEYKSAGTEIRTNSKGENAYIAGVTKKGCMDGLCGYWLFFNEKGKLLGKKNLKVTIGQM